MRILITGSRDLRAVNVVKQALAAVTAGHRGPHTLVHGNAPGADQIAAAVAQRFGWIAEPHPADWDHCGRTCPPGHRVTRAPRDNWHPGVRSEYCPDAGPRRNQEMVDLGADVVVAFLKAGARNSGTRDCVRRAEAAGLTVRKVEV